MTITRINYESGNEKGRIELKGRFLIELRVKAFSGTNGEDAIEHIENFLEIVHLLNIRNISNNQLRVRVFPFSLTGAASKKIEDNGDNSKVKWDPNNIEFENWLASKFRNHKTMDGYTKNDLWDYSRNGNDEEVISDTFKEFNYLSQIDVDVLTNDIPGFKTYKEYKDDWIYEWTKGIRWVNEKPWTNNGAWNEPIDNFHHECNPFRFKNRTAI
ncbi:hypothetical protein Tco_0227049 [Tanacetum coccineum]